MELSKESMHDVIYPTASFCGVRQEIEPRTKPLVARDIPWQDSYLNPQNRIESLEVPRQPLWEIDRCTAFGSQFYATPLFISSPIPLRIGVLIPEPSTLPRETRKLLDADVFFYTRDKHRIAHLGLTRHLLRILCHWASDSGDPQIIYRNLPFGSWIVLRNLPLDIRKADIVIAPAYNLERQLLSVFSLAAYWGNETELPGLVDINNVVYISQLHDHVCLIKIDGQVWTFKALTSHPKYLYHELHRLLTIKPHPNIIAKPVHLVTKVCKFGGKVAVIGFTTEYHPPGSLQDLIPFLQLHQKISLADKTKWGVQLSSALSHLCETTSTCYPDLRLDKIVLSESNDIIIIDFDQRGVWYDFVAPEVNAIEYMRILAMDGETPQDEVKKYAKILSHLLPNWRNICEGEEYLGPSGGYNVPWNCLTPAEQEYCEVYMLGMVLWCIFEAKSAPQRAVPWLPYLGGPAVEYPNYTTTPTPMRALIDRCTRGWRPGLSKYIVRGRNQLVLRHQEHTGQSTVQEIQETARRWWVDEIHTSERWLRARAKGRRKGTWNENHFDRPSLRQVHSELLQFYQQIRGATR